jgi:hypothetical chaperone protein
MQASDIRVGCRRAIDRRQLESAAFGGITRVMTPTVYAIDFGTTNSLLAAANGDRTFAPIALDPSADDPTMLRSVLFFPDATRVYFGAEAIREYGEHGMRGRLLRSIKKHLPSRAFIGTNIDNRPMNLEDLVAAILGHMRRRANEHFGADVDRVVLGRPALFSKVPEDDRFAEYRLERAAKQAGFREVTFCPEPVAAAASYAEKIDGETLTLIVDLGGGTSDYTVVRMRPDGYRAEDVLATHGVPTAGDALDGAVMRAKIAKHFGAEVTYRVPFGANVLTMPSKLRYQLCSPADLSALVDRDAQAFLRDVQRWSLGEEDEARLEQLFTLVNDGLGFAVFEPIERAKRTLSSEERTEIVFEYPGIEVREPITRAELERASERETSDIIGALDATLAQAGVAAKDIGLVCCTGGTARVLGIRRALEERFGKEKLRDMRSFHSVILGLAERAREIALEGPRTAA